MLILYPKCNRLNTDHVQSKTPLFTQIPNTLRDRDLSKLQANLRLPQHLCGHTNIG